MKFIGNHRAIGINTYSIAFNADTKASLQAKVKWSSSNKWVNRYHLWYGYSFMHNLYTKLGTMLKGKA